MCGIAEYLFAGLFACVALYLLITSIYEWVTQIPEAEDSDRERSKETFREMFRELQITQGTVERIQVVLCHDGPGLHENLFSLDTNTLVYKISMVGSCEMMGPSLELLPEILLEEGFLQANHLVIEIPEYNYLGACQNIDLPAGMTMEVHVPEN